MTSRPHYLVYWFHKYDQSFKTNINYFLLTLVLSALSFYVLIAQRGFNLQASINYSQLTLVFRIFRFIHQYIRIFKNNIN